MTQLFGVLVELTFPSRALLLSSKLIHNSGFNGQQVIVSVV